MPSTLADAGAEDPDRLKLEVIASTGEQVEDYEASLRAPGSDQSVEWDDPDEAPFARALAPGRYSLQIKASDYEDQDLTVELPAPQNTLHVRLVSTWAEITGQIVTEGPPISKDATLDADIADQMSGSSDDGVIEPDGHFRVRVSRPGRFRLDFHDDALGAASELVIAPARGVRLTPKRGAGVRLVLRNLARPGITGHVPQNRDSDDDDGDDSADVEGTIGSSPDHDPDWSVDLTVMSDRHEIWGLPPGPAQIAISVGDQSVHQQVTLREGELTDAVLIFQSKRVIDGRVVDTAGRPLAGAAVEVGDDSMHTEDDGRFEFADVPEGDRVEVGHLGYSTLTVPVGSGHLGDLVLTALTPRHLTGRVHGAEGERIARFTVSLPGREYAQTVDTVAGDFSIDVPPEAEWLLFEADGYDKRPARLFPDRSELEVTLVAARSIEGTVLSASGAPISGAIVSCGDCGADATTDANGHFQLAGFGSHPWVAAHAATGSAVGQAGNGPIVLRLAAPVSFHATLPVKGGTLQLLGFGTELNLPVAADGTVSATVDRGSYSIMYLTPDQSVEWLETKDGHLFHDVLLDAPSVELELRVKERARPSGEDRNGAVTGADDP